MANAFEVRLEVLKMAKDLTVEQFYREHDILRDRWSLEASKATENDRPLPPEPNYPKFPSTDEVIRKAKELNEFISNS